MSIKVSDIEAQLSAQTLDDAWAHYIVIIAACMPFWGQAIVEMARLAGVKADKVDAYRTIAQGAFPLLNNWYFGHTPYVKARRNEIDTVISFIRNAALRQTVGSTAGAAAARNLASALRGAVYLSVHDYPPKAYPRLMAGHLLDVAAAKSLFPVDTTDLVSQFALPKQPPSDNIAFLQAALERGADHYGLQKALDHLYKTLDDLWQHRDTPKPWVVPATAWEPQETSLLTDVHYRGVQDFHTRGSK